MWCLSHWLEAVLDAHWPQIGSYPVDIRISTGRIFDDHKFALTQDGGNSEGGGKGVGAIARTYRVPKKRRQHFRKRRFLNYLNLYGHTGLSNFAPYNENE